MEAKDTVKSDLWFKWELNGGDYNIDGLKKGAEAQAEITWPVAFAAGEEAALKEVGEWLCQPCCHGRGSRLNLLRLECDICVGWLRIAADEGKMPEEAR